MSMIAKFIAAGACAVSLCVQPVSYLHEPQKIEIPAAYCKDSVPETCLIDELISRLERNKIDTIDSLSNLTDTIDNGLLFMSKEQAARLSNLTSRVSKEISVPVYVTNFVKAFIETRKRDEMAPPAESAAYVAMLTTANKAKLASVTTSVDEVVNLTRIATHVKMDILDREYPQRRIAALYLHRGELDKTTQYIIKTKDMTFPDKQSRSSRYPGVGDPAIGLMRKYLDKREWKSAYNLIQILQRGSVYCAEHSNCNIDELWYKISKSESQSAKTFLKNYCQEQTNILLQPATHVVNTNTEYYGAYNATFLNALNDMMQANCFEAYPPLLASINTDSPFPSGEYLRQVMMVLKGNALKVLEVWENSGKKLDEEFRYFSDALTISANFI